jgi:hypothetical protein
MTAEVAEAILIIFYSALSAYPDNYRDLAFSAVKLLKLSFTRLL